MATDTQAVHGLSAPGRHRLILVREQDAQHSGSGCCGRLGEAHTRFGKAADYAMNRARMEQMGEIYRELSERAPDLELDIADPRNWMWLYPAVWRAARGHGQGVGATLRSLAAAGSPVAVVLDGEVLFSGRLPDSDTVVAAVLARLAARPA